MGGVVILYRILPKGPEFFPALKAALLKLEPARLEEEPIGYGLVALKFAKQIPDSPGADEILEDQIRAIPEVESVETLAVTRGF